MAISGKGCFVAWFDLKPGCEADHDDWHTHEHMTERVAILGFRRGFRYRSLTGSPRTCVIYQADTVETFAAPAYLERLNNPTPWTVQSMPILVGMNRTLCTVVSTYGHGVGGYLVTVQLGARAGCDERLKNWLCDEALPALAARAGLCGAHLLIGDREISQIKTQEKSLRGGSDAVADWVLLVEGYDRAATERVVAELTAPAGLAEHGAADNPIAGLYSLDYCLDELEAKKIWRNPGLGSPL